MRQKLAAMNNRAVYEIPPLLAKILANPPVTM
jgi:hypothetical protein